MTPKATLDGNAPADERTPLLTEGELGQSPEASNGTLQNASTNGHLQPKPIATTEEDLDDAEGEKPMPYLQIISLCYASLAEPVAFFAIFPFINEMLERVGEMPETSGEWSPNGSLLSFLTFPRAINVTGLLFGCAWLCKR